VSGEKSHFIHQKIPKITMKATKIIKTASWGSDWSKGKKNGVYSQFFLLNKKNTNWPKSGPFLCGEIAPSFELGSRAWDRVQNSGPTLFFYFFRAYDPSLSLPCFLLYPENQKKNPIFFRSNSILLQFVNRLRETSYRSKESRKNPSIRRFYRHFEGIFDFKFKSEFIKISNFVRFS
jgi:hypothetical protein